MSITHQVSINSTLSYCIWKIEESEEELLDILHLNSIELADFQRAKVPAKRLEWLAARNALKHLVSPYGQFFLIKDEFGKPHLDRGDIQVSMSHANGYGAAAIQHHKPVGIDIELERPQIKRIAKKFLHEKEKEWCAEEVEDLTKIWGAKEALYKLHGRTQLIFAEQLLIHPFDQQKGEIYESGKQDAFQIHYDKTDALYICTAY